MTEKQIQALKSLNQLRIDLKNTSGDLPRDLEITLEDIKEYILRNF